MRVSFLEIDRKSTRLNSSHTVIYTLSLHDALPISIDLEPGAGKRRQPANVILHFGAGFGPIDASLIFGNRSEEHTSELQSHSDLHSFPTRRSSDLHRSRTRRRETATARECDFALRRWVWPNRCESHFWK